MRTSTPSPFAATRAPLVRDALAHPGFAHVPANRLTGVLYSYMSCSEGVEECHINWSITAMRAFTLSHAANRLGVCCCLCSAIRRDPGHRTSLPFCKWLVGDFDGSCVAGFRAHPLCSGCNAKVLVTSLRKDKLRLGRHYLPSIDPDEFPEVLCSIYADRAFRARVENNAETFRSLRFDPRLGRQPQEMAA